MRSRAAGDLADSRPAQELGLPNCRRLPAMRRRGQVYVRPHAFRSNALTGLLLCVLRGAGGVLTLLAILVARARHRWREDERAHGLAASDERAWSAGLWDVGG